MQNSEFTDKKLSLFFSHLDVNNSGTITTTELQRVLLNGDWTPFNLDTIQLLFDLFDQDRNGYIHYQEFVGLWRYIEDWKKIYAAFDQDNSGDISINELTLAMRNFGFNISEKILTKFVKKYKIKYSSGEKKVINEEKLSVNFDNFIQICVTVKDLTDVFRTLDENGDGWAKMNYNQFMELMIKHK
ncbi:11651_t:CDS:1 [Acaulospora morrowiae]|uniref:11651_t:CDS:1 n=1 Tax=Acaulospora morrowiae TaxID=94023 RepID=A0A9N8W973_9GLOM|nr:11651_t:CDS:1 [Acaulospora morrowiae]